MRWEDEKYVRIYTRDTVDWLGLSFIAQGLFCLVLRKVDRAGILDLGKHGRRAVAIAIGFPGEWARLEPALDELLADGCIRIEGDHLLVPNFIEAQEATQSDAARKRAQRERARARVTERDDGHGQTPDTRDIPSRNVTPCHDTGQKVTSGHAESNGVTRRSHGVTRGHSSLAEPSEPSVQEACLPARARAGDEPKSAPEAVEPATPLPAEEAASGATQPPAPSAEAERLASVLSAPLEPGYVPPGFRKPIPVDPNAPDDDWPPARKLPVVDEVELPPQAAVVRAELERQLGRVLALAGREEFAAQVARLEQAEAGMALRVCVEAASEYLRRSGEAPGSLAWFAGAMAKYLGVPVTLGAPPPLPEPDEAWLVTLGDRRSSAERQWATVLERVTGPRSGVWVDRRREVLERELAGLVERFTEPLSAAGGTA